MYDNFQKPCQYQISNIHPCLTPLPNSDDLASVALSAYSFCLQREGQPLAPLLRGMTPYLLSAALNGLVEGNILCQFSGLYFHLKRLLEIVYMLYTVVVRKPHHLAQAGGGATELN